MPATYEPIATYTFTSSATSYTFTSIPSTYTDLVLVANVKNTSFEVFNLQFNGDTGSNYSWTTLQGNASSATSGRTSTNNAVNIGLRRNGMALNVFHLNNYSNTTTYKTILAANSAVSDQIRLHAGVWRTTSAISSIRVGAGNSFTAGTMMTLYGITAA
jgi:hypothetical protein